MAPPTSRKTAKASRSRKVPQKRSKAAVPLKPINSGEEFSFEDTDDDTPDMPESDDPLVLESRSGCDDSHHPSVDTTALDIAHFFVTVDGPETEDGVEVLRVCKLCMKDHGTDRDNIPSKVSNYFYQTSTGFNNLRKHMHKLHPIIYDQAVEENNWPYKLSTQAKKSSSHKNTSNVRDRSLPQFSQEVFLDHLVSFIVADDQSIRVVECPEFRKLCMVLRETLLDSDIPRRDKTREAIIYRWKKSFEELSRELTESCGRISFTADVWSNGNLAAFLALTAHWISSDKQSGSLSLKVALIGFRRLKKKHTGRNIARTLLHLIDRAGITHKIGYFTLDNASNNAVAMDELQDLLVERKIPGVVRFDNLTNRVRCYAHIINICCSHVIASFTSVPKSYLTQLDIPLDHDYVMCDDLDSDSESDCSDDDITDDQDYDLELPHCYSSHRELKKWVECMKGDPLKRARRVIRILRSSDKHRIGLQKVIQDGNKHGWFTRSVTDNKDKSASVPVQVPELQLLRDVKTRWDSVYKMLLRLRQLRPAIDWYFNTKIPELSRCKLSDQEWEILEGLEVVLLVPHTFQQTMSSESTPVLSRAISDFEMFMTEWENLGHDHKILKFWTEIGLRWAKKYYVRMDETDAYVVAMFLNPSMRFSWINSEWEDKYIQGAKETIFKLMHKYRLRNPSLLPITENSNPLVSRSEGQAPPTRFKVRRSAYAKKSSLQEFTVDAEFRKYASGDLTSHQSCTLKFWEANKNEYPTLFAIAMDYLPIQATSVPCERVFSSAKETDTAKRNRISPILMEALQMLKFMLKKQRLNFMDGWVVPEAVMEVVTKSGRDLGAVLTDNSDVEIDGILKDFCTYD